MEAGSIDIASSPPLKEQGIQSDVQESDPPKKGVQLSITPSENNVSEGDR